MTANENETVADLLKRRWELLRLKKTAFDTCVQVASELYLKEDPQRTFCQSMVPMVKQHWERLTDEQQKPCRQLMRQENMIIDIKVKEIDELITRKRDGPLAEKDKELKDKMAFDPIFWYMCSTHHEKCKNVANYEWRHNVPQLRVDAIESWSSLSEDARRRFIKRAQDEYALYTGEPDVDGLVLAILDRTLKEHEATVKLNDVDEGASCH